MGHCPNSIKQKAAPLGAAFFFKAPGSDLLSHGLSHTTIGAGAFHCRVRDGIGWDHAAVSAREAVLQVALLRLACIRTWDVTYDELSHVLMRAELQLDLESFFSESSACALTRSAVWN